MGDYYPKFEKKHQGGQSEASKLPRQKFWHLYVIMSSRYLLHLYASLSLGMHTYSDRQLSPYFEFWVEIFCVQDVFPYEDFKTVSVCSYPEKRNHPGFVNISPILVIDASKERSSRVLHHGNPKNWIFLF